MLDIESSVLLYACVIWEMKAFLQLDDYCKALITSDDLQGSDQFMVKDVST